METENRQSSIASGVTSAVPVVPLALVQLQAWGTLAAQAFKRHSSRTESAMQALAEENGRDAAGADER